MPVYFFKCKKCGQELEVEHSFSEPHPTECPHLQVEHIYLPASSVAPDGRLTHEVRPVVRMEPCGGELERIFSTPNVIFIGSGFYSVDKRLTPVDPLDRNDMEDG